MSNHNINISIPAEMRAEIREAASEDFGSVSAWVRKAISQRLAVRRASIKRANKTKDKK